jgi:hypothetical protein
MKKEELLNIEFENKKELTLSLCEFFDFELANDEEKKMWPYKSELFISIKNLNGKELYNNKKLIGIIDECYFGKTYRGRDAVMIKCKEKKYSLTDSQIKIYNKFSEKEELIDLHPSRKGIKFWSYGHILSEKNYKSLYYKTKEYRDEYEKSLNENLGTNGIKSPIQCPKIKKKISKTIEEKYGVNWFLERGLHYSAVTITMEEKFGVDNLFKSHEWQMENFKNLSVGVSKVEIEFIEYINSLIKEFYPKYHKYSEYFNSKKHREGVYDYENKKTYNPDFINKKLKIFIEFNGDYWHCNPTFFDENYFNTQKMMTAKEVWGKDLNRKKAIEKITNCQGLIVWENDWCKNKSKTQEIIKKFLNETVKN